MPIKEPLKDLIRRGPLPAYIIRDHKYTPVIYLRDEAQAEKLMGLYKTDSWIDVEAETPIRIVSIARMGDSWRMEGELLQVPPASPEITEGPITRRYPHSGEVLLLLNTLP